MKLKDKIKSYSFWVSIASAVILILKVLGNRFGFVVDESMVSDIFTAICSVLVLLGIIVVPSQPNSQQNSQFNNNSLFNQSDVNKENNQVENLLNNNKLDDINEPQFSEEKELDFDDNQKVSDFSNETLQSNEDDLCKTPETTTQPDTIGGNFKKIPEENLNQAIQVTEDNNYSETPNDTTITTTQHDEQLDDNSKTTELNNLQNNPLVEVTEIFQNSNSNGESQNTQPLDNLTNLKELLNQEREKFSNNISEYIFELQEEIRKTRERM